MKISIIIPVYNVAAELPRMMASLKAQTVRDYEVVLVDDGSTDGSSALVDTYAGVATVVHQSHAGVVAARQKGFEESSGEWIVFADGDDRLRPDALEKVSAEISRADADIVQFGYDEIWPTRTYECPPGFVGAHSADELLAQVKKTPLEIVRMCIWNKCYRRSVAAAAFADVGDVRISYGEDGLFALVAFLHAQKISFLSDRLYEYVIRPGSAAQCVNEKIVDEKEIFFDRMKKLMVDSRKFTAEAIERCLDFHGYEAACSIFLMLRRQHADKSTSLKILNELNRSRFFNRPNREWNTAKRKVMRYLLAHPRLNALLGPAIDLVYT